VNAASAPQTTLPNIEDYTDYIYEGYDYGSVVFPSYPADQQAIDDFLGLTQPPGAGISPSSITVSVLDGSGVAGTGAAAAAKLATLGYHASFANSQTSVGTPAETLVEYSSGHVADAERVAKSLSGIVAMAEDPTTGGADVTVIAGTNFHVVMPGKGAHHSQTTTTTTSPSLGPLSHAVQGLPWYDPRACPTT
jgi:hypothetical protein